MGRRALWISVIIMMLMLPNLSWARQGLSVPILSHVWASKKIDAAVWGVAIGDVDGKGGNELVLLERNAVRIASIDNDNFKIVASYEWEGELQGVRLFLKNLDDDPQKEILISAVFNQGPDSFALKWSDGVLKPVFEHVPWHLRVLDQERLVGQQRDSESFFAGYVYELSFDKGRLKRGDRLRFPKWASIYDFAILPPSADNPRIMRLSGNEPLLLYEYKKKRFKRMWSSGVRYGGTLNIVEAFGREPLGITTGEDVSFDREPEVIIDKDTLMIVAPQHDVPLKGVIGNRPFIRSGKLVAWREDPSLGFAQDFETEEVPGYISDFVVETFETQPTVTIKRIIASVQQNPSMFTENEQSVILIFNLPQ